MLLHLLLLAFLSPVRADQGCVALLEHPAPSVLMAPPPSRKALSPDQSFSAYFSDLLQETILGTEELLVYKKNLEEGRIVNPITDHLALMRDGAWVHQDSLARHIGSGELTIEGQLKWAEGKIEERGYNLERQEITRADTREMRLSQVYPFVKMIPLSGGKFTMGSSYFSRTSRWDSKRRVRVELSSFEIMDAPVTQRFWVEVMRENPSRLKNRRHCKNHTFIGEIELCPDLPVESVSWDDVQKFIGKLNEEWGFSAEDGYRLPTEAEWEYAARAGSTGKYFFGSDVRDLEKFAVYNASLPLPVRSKLPNPWGLYDMYGNVKEWIQDFYTEKLPGGVDPLVNYVTHDHVIRGGGWQRSEAKEMRSSARSWGASWIQAPDLGFRLARRVEVKD